MWQPFLAFIDSNGQNTLPVILILRTFVMYQNSRKVLAILVLSWVVSQKPCHAIEVELSDFSLMVSGLKIIGVINVVYTLRWAKSFSSKYSLSCSNRYRD